MNALECAIPDESRKFMRVTVLAQSKVCFMWSGAVIISTFPFIKLFVLPEIVIRSTFPYLKQLYRLDWQQSWSSRVASIDDNVKAWLDSQGGFMLRNVRELVKAFMLRHKLQVHKSHWSITTRTSSEKCVIAQDVHEMWRVEINSTFAHSCALGIQENNEQLGRPANIPVPKTRAKNHNKHCFSFASVSFKHQILLQKLLSLVNVQ